MTVMMKTSNEILERIKSPESIDFANVQRSQLISLLPFEMAKEFIDPEYVKAYADLPEDEKWNTIDPEKLLVEILPHVYNTMNRDNFIETKKALLNLKALIWVVDEEFFNTVETFFYEPTIANMEEGFKIIAKHFGYVPAIENIDFEEVD